MANLTRTELDKIYRKARRISRTPRTSPSFTSQTAPPKVSLPRHKKPNGTVKPKSTRSLGFGKVLLFLGALGLLVLVLGSQVDWTAHMTQTVTVARDPSAWKAMLEAQGSADDTLLDELEQNGQIFTLERGTAVELVGLGIASRKVRVVEGEETGRAGWVHSQFVALE